MPSYAVVSSLTFAFVFVFAVITILYVSSVFFFAFNLLFSISKSFSVNKLSDDVFALEEEVANLKAKDTSTDEAIASLSATMAETAKNIRDEFKEADDLIKESIQSHTNTYNDRITNLEALVGSNKSSLDGQISDLNSIVTSNKSSKVRSF